MPNRIQIQGTVIDKQSKQGLSALRVEAWGEIAAASVGGVSKNSKLPKESGKGEGSGCEAKKLGQAITKNGKFSIDIDRSQIENLVGGEKAGKVYFKVFDSSGELLVDTKGDVVWLPKCPEHVTIKVTIEESEYSVHGLILGANGKPLIGVTVCVFRKDSGKEELLGESVTNEVGRYAISYTPTPLGGVKNKRVDLIVRVFDSEDKYLAASKLVSNAKPVETIDITVLAQTSPADEWWITGKIYLEYGLPAKGLTLRLYRRDFGGEMTLLGETTTLTKGQYIFAVDPGSKTASLEIRAVKGGDEILLTNPVDDRGAGAAKELNLLAPSELQPLAAEYRRIKSDLVPHVGEMAKLAEAREDSEQHDLAVLNRATGWDARLLALAANTERLSADEDVQLPPEGLYGLLRAGLPADKQSLSRVAPDVAVKTLEKMRDADVVELTDQDIAEFKEAFSNFSSRVRLAAPIPGSKSTYGDMLASSGLDDDAQAKFAGVYLSHSGNADELWNRASKAGLDDEQIGRLQLQGKLAFLAGNSEAMTARLSSKPITDPVELVDIDLHRKESWANEIYDQAEVPQERRNNLSAEDKQRLSELIPAAYIGTQITDRLNTYAEDMARKIRLSYPTQVVIRLVTMRDILLHQVHDLTASILKRAAQLGFRFGETPVASFLADHPELRTDITQVDFDAAAQNMKILQRLYQITPSNEAMPVLMNLGISSAYDVLAYKESDFSALFEAKYQEVHGINPPQEEIRLILNKSRQISSVTNNLVATLKRLSNEPSVTGLSASTEDHQNVRDNLIKRFPTMETLLNSMDYCECEHCRSVLSPAAYLIDLLQFIDPEEEEWNNLQTIWKATHNNQDYPHKDADGNAMKPYDVLIERRPDLPHIPLTCENTHTALPYIDVVNEILEYYVAKEKLEVATARDTGKATTEELLAEPQNIISEAYDKLHEARYPLNLPFDLWLETVREFCAYTEMPLHEVLETLRESDSLFAPSQPYDRASIFIESLGISPDEAAIFADADPLASGRWLELYGFPSDRPEIQITGTNGSSMLTVSTEDIRLFKEGLVCAYFDLSENALNEESKTIAHIGADNSGGIGRSLIIFTDVWAPLPQTGDLLVCHAEEMLKSAKYLSRRLGVAYKELVEIIQTGFVNPKLTELSLLYKLGVNIHDARFYRDHIELLGQDPDTLLEEEQKQQLEVSAFFERLRQLADSYELSLEWLDAQVSNIPFDQILLLADPDTGCNFDQTTLRYADGSPADAFAFLKINLFVRLWRKLGWTIEETDRAMQAFMPDYAPFDTGHLEMKPLLTVLIYLAHLKSMDDKLGIGKQSRIKLVTLWSDLATTGKDPLYAQLFLTRSVLKSDPVFDHPLGKYLDPAWIFSRAEMRTYSAQLENVDEDDRIDPAQFADEESLELIYDEARNVQSLSFKGVLSDAKKTSLIARSSSTVLPILLDSVQTEAEEFVLIKGHMLTLQGALGLTAEEIYRILEDASRTDERFTDIDSAKLSLFNVSLLYRYALLAKALNLSVWELIALKQLSEVDPFRPLEPDSLTEAYGSPPTPIEVDHLFCHTLRFIEIADVVKESGLTIEDLDYLLRHRFDEAGQYRPDPEGTLLQLKTLAEGIRAIRLDHAVPEDPATLSDEALRQKLGLVLQPDVADTFIAMMKGTVEYTASRSGPDRLDPTAFANEPAIVEVSYDEVLQEQKLTVKGVLSDAAKADLMARLPTPVPPNPHVPSQVFSDLLDQVQQQARTFFEKYLQKQAPDTQPVGGFLDYATDFALLFDPNLPLEDGETEQDRIRSRREIVAKAFLPFLQQRLISQFVVQTMTAQTGADSALMESLLTGQWLLYEQKPLLRAFAATDDPGLTVTFFASADATGAAMATMTFFDANTGLKDKEGKPLKPAGANSAIIEGYFEVPKPETYRFFIALEKQGTEAILRFNHLPEPVFLSGAAATDNQVLSEFLELKPGIPYRFTLELRTLNEGNAQLFVQGETLAKDGVSQLTLYTANAVASAQRVLVLLNKVLQLVQGLGLSEREIRYLSTHAGAFNDLNLSILPTNTIDNKHNSTGMLFSQFLCLAGYVNLKKELAGSTDDLIAIFEANELTASDKLEKEVYPRVAKLTRRDESTVKNCAEALFAKPVFDSEKPLQRLWQLLQIVERFGIPVASLLECSHILSTVLTPAQRFEVARNLKDVTKARFTPEVWKHVAQPIFDRLRQRQRNTLSAHVMHQKGFDRLEQLYEYFLIDPGMEPVVQTSRIRLAIASVQLFIQRSLLNLELKVQPSTIDSKQWEWMKRYRVWEANRKIFLYPENWLEPEFRDDKTHLFTELEGALLQGDVTRDLVEDAFFNYLKKLDELARLDIVAMHIEENPYEAQHTLHVIGRTYSQPHKYFYRRYVHRMWTPWEPVSTEIEGDHLAPVVWRERLYLFWVTFMDKPDSESSVDSATGSRNAGDLTLSELVTGLKTMVTTKQIDVQLHWSELTKGEWSARKSGGLISAIVPTNYKTDSAFIHVSKEYDPDDGRELGVFIHLGGAFRRTFYLAGRNCNPESRSYGNKPVNPFSSADLVLANRYSGRDALKVRFHERITAQIGKTPPTANSSILQGSLHSSGSYTLLPCNNNLLLSDMTAEDLQIPRRIVNNFGTGDSAGSGSIENWRPDRHLRFVVDMTGDGRADIVGFGNEGVWIAFNKGDGTFDDPVMVSNIFGCNPESWGWSIGSHPRFVADMTGSGNADIVGFANNGVHVAFNNGNRTFQEVQHVIRFFGKDSGEWLVSRHPRFLADLTGNGCADIIGFHDDGVWTAINNGDGHFQAQRFVLDHFGFVAGGYRIEYHPRFVVDLTGNGRADILGIAHDGVYVSLGKGDGTFHSPEKVIDDFGGAAGWRVESHPRFLADLTGDGRPDLVGFGNDGVYAAFSNGDGTFQPPRRVTKSFCYNKGWRVDKYPRFLADLTGDGRSDIIGFGSKSIEVALNNGDGTFQLRRKALEDFFCYNSGWRVGWHPRFLADLTGDGRADIIGFGVQGTWATYVNYGDVQNSSSEIITLQKPVFYQDGQHTFFIESSLQEKTTTEWTRWVVRTTQSEPVLLEENISFSVNAAISQSWATSSVATIAEPNIDPSSLITPNTQQDWVINSEKTVKFNGVDIGPFGEYRVGAATPGIRGLR